MSGGITQLVAIGAQDAHLVGNPEVSFFRTAYRRHTNFSQVTERLLIQGNPTNNGMSTVRIERKGDMVGYMYITPLTSAGEATTFTANCPPIDKVEVLIGGQVIDTQSNIFTSMIANPYTDSTAGKVLAQTPTDPGSPFYPLKFWFNENWQSALPLVSLQYHDVELRITWGDDITTGTGTIARFECWANFIYLDTAEREQLSSKPQEILIYQVQKASAAAASTTMLELNFNHPIKFLASAAQIIHDEDAGKLALQVNGVTIGEPKNYNPHFTTAPRYYHTTFGDGLRSAAPGTGNTAFLYPFCLDTNKLQPTGSLNFSRLDSARLSIENSTFATSPTIANDIYAVNYNVLRVENGMGGLMYAN